MRFDWTIIDLGASVWGMGISNRLTTNNSLVGIRDHKGAAEIPH